MSSWPIASFRWSVEFWRHREIADIVRMVGYAFRFCSSSCGGKSQLRLSSCDLRDLPAESSPSAKDFPLCPTGKSSLQAGPVRAHQRGRIAIVTKRWAWMRWTRLAQSTKRNPRTAKSCGPDAPTLASSWRRCFRIALATVARKPGHRGERDISCKTIARGMPGVSGVTVVTNARVFYHHARLRAQPAPGIPCAL